MDSLASIDVNNLAKDTVTRTIEEECNPNKTRTEANGFSFDVSQNDHGVAIHICLMDNHDRT